MAAAAVAVAETVAAGVGGAAAGGIAGGAARRLPLPIVGAVLPVAWRDGTSRTYTHKRLLRMRVKRRQKREERTMQRGETACEK